MKNEDFLQILNDHCVDRTEYLKNKYIEELEISKRMQEEEREKECERDRKQREENDKVYYKFVELIKKQLIEAASQGLYVEVEGKKQIFGSFAIETISYSNWDDYSKDYYLVCYIRELKKETYKKLFTTKEIVKSVDVKRAAIHIIKTGGWFDNVFAAELLKNADETKYFKAFISNQIINIKFISDYYSKEPTLVDYDLTYCCLEGKRMDFVITF